jgi:butyryl-CoA dehydrogenase
MASANTQVTAKVAKGGSFLLEDSHPQDIFTPEDFTEEHRQIARTAVEFTNNEVLPAADQIEAKDFAVTKALLRKAGELGLMGVDVPEEYGGLAMDKVTSALIADSISKLASFSVAFSAHVGIGTLPIVWYGTAEQKQKYLPKLATGEWIAAYALSESSSGSDALNCRTRAVLSADGKHYVLNGEKMWITNSGFADIFTVFAKIDGEKFSAFLIERNTPGLTVGAEEHKLGIRGSSTCPLILSDCTVPVENLLGEAGKGHHIAFNILNIGRFKLGAACVGGARFGLQNAIGYAKERKAFGKTISQFGLVQEKLAESTPRWPPWIRPLKTPLGRFRSASRSTRSSARSSRSGARRCSTWWSITSSRFTRATATWRSIRPSALIAIRASTASSRALTRSIASSSRGG